MTDIGKSTIVQSSVDRQSSFEKSLEESLEIVGDSNIYHHKESQNLSKKKYTSGVSKFKLPSRNSADRDSMANIYRDSFY